MSVTGIGGFFFRCADPEGLAAWYREHLGVGDGEVHWQQAAGPTVFVPFEASSPYFPADKQWMLNFRVANLDALLADLAAAGVSVPLDAVWHSPGIGRVARVFDPEGNAIELWELPQ